MNRFSVRSAAMVGVIIGVSAAPALALTSQGLSAMGSLDTTPPGAGSLMAPAVVNSAPIEVSFTGVMDADSAIESVELWVRKDDESWAVSDDVSGVSSGSFLFNPPGAPPDSYGTYRFQLVAVDSRGNRSPEPSGLGDGGQGATEFIASSSVSDWWVIQ